ncbi:MAG TPA: hypothetical protein VMA37_11245 [Acetobacteraceae bacterium]|nr:hypothetical protein [Acetobacteraceae bacterium]
MFFRVIHPFGESTCGDYALADRPAADNPRPAALQNNVAKHRENDSRNRQRLELRRPPKNVKATAIPPQPSSSRRFCEVDMVSKIRPAIGESHKADHAEKERDDL